jgi:deoxyribodipyrimidine photo-lyase
MKMTETLATNKGATITSARTQVVWFKRDFRTFDNECLMQAAVRGPVFAILVIEPTYWQLPETSWRQFEAQRQAIQSLQEQLVSIGGTLNIWTGDAVNALCAILGCVKSFDLWAHQETGNHWTYRRDNAVRAWCSEHKITFTEPVQYGVWRGSRLNRDKWAKDWAALMAVPRHEQPTLVQWIDDQLTGFAHELPTAEDLGLEAEDIAGIQPCGRDAALATLRSFLYQRGRNYSTDMSSPRLGAMGCSRMSVHLATGSISMRECYQATLRRVEELTGINSEDARACPLETCCPGITKICRIDPENGALTATRASGGRTTVAGIIPTTALCAMRAGAVLMPKRLICSGVNAPAGAVGFAGAVAVA